MYNNETGLYEFDEVYFDGDWFEDKDGLLYIRPRTPFDEIDGPDNEISDFLSAIPWELPITDNELETLGLIRVDDVLKRFTPEEGYYHA